MENRLQKYKTETGMILSKMSKLTNLSVQTLSAIMSKTPEGIIKLKISTLITIFETLGINLIADIYRIEKINKG